MVPNSQRVHGEAMSHLNYRKLLLVTFIDVFSPLESPEEKRRFEELIKTPEYRELGEFRRTWIDLFTRVGLLEASRSTLLRQIRAKFGPPTEELVWKVRSMKSLDELDGHLDRLLTVQSLEDMGPLAPNDSTIAGKSYHGEIRTSGLDHYRKSLMLGLFEALTPDMTREEARQFKDATLGPEYRDRGVFQDTWVEEAMMNALLEGKRSTLLRQLGARFGSVPKRVVQRIRRLKSLDDLDSLLDHVVTARSLEGMGLLRPADSPTP